MNRTVAIILVLAGVGTSLYFFVFKKSPLENSVGSVSGKSRTSVRSRLSRVRVR